MENLVEVLVVVPETSYGEWVSLPLPEDELKQKMENILKGEEEYLIEDISTDYCDENLNIGHANIYTINKVLKELVYDEEGLIKVLFLVDYEGYSWEEIDEDSLEKLYIYNEETVYDLLYNDNYFTADLLDISINSKVFYYLDYNKISNLLLSNNFYEFCGKVIEYNA